MKRTWWILITLALLAGMAVAQSEAPPPPQAGAAAVAPRAGRAPRRVERKEIRIVREPDGGNVMYFRGAGLGKWWKNAQLVKELGVSDAQVQQMEKIFLDYRLKLVDLKGTLEKAEIQLEPMMNAGQPDEQGVLAQIDKVASARAELEKSNARMQFAIRRVLTAEQWKKLQAKKAETRGNMTFRRFSLPAPPPDAPDAPEPPPAPPDEN
jgi:Spy/CpxP family protein refolding chaperone